MRLQCSVQLTVTSLTLQKHTIIGYFVTVTNCTQDFWPRYFTVIVANPFVTNARYKIYNYPSYLKIVKKIPAAEFLAKKQKHIETTL
jgi:hypothetical protein